MSIIYDGKHVDEIVECDKESLIGSVEGRYLLKVKLKNNFTDTLTVAMMNPSKADETYSDNTVNKVISFVYEMNSIKDSKVRNIGYINIVNIFPAYEPSSGKVKDKLNQIIFNKKLDTMQKKNKDAFEKAVSESQRVVFAWGDVPSKVKARYHNHETIMMYELINHYGLRKETFVFKYKEYEQILTNKKRPRHPSRNTPEYYVKVRSMKVSRGFLNIALEQ